MTGEAGGPPRAPEELAAAFCAGTLPRAEWTHEAHLTVGAWHVHHHGRDAALALLRARIRRLNERHGTINGPTTGYHETITAAYVRLIAEFLAAWAAAAQARDLGGAVAALLASPLAERAALFRYWSRERLLSPEARAAWVEPDLAPLAWPPAES